MWLGWFRNPPQDFFEIFIINFVSKSMNSQVFWHSQIRSDGLIPRIVSIPGKGKKFTVKDLEQPEVIQEVCNCGIIRG